MSASRMILEAHHITRYGSGAHKALLDDVSIELCAGDRIALIGPSGSGKSLLLRALAILDPIQKGTLLFHGRPITDVPRYRSTVIYLPQKAGLIEGTVESNLHLPFDFRVHRTKNYDGDRIVEWLTRSGRDKAFLSRNTGILSGGEIQIVALLRALQLAPEVLLLDEPTAALDEAAAGVLEEMVHDWVAENPGRAFIWVSHDAALARRVSSRQWHIEHGKLKTS